MVWNSINGAGTESTEGFSPGGNSGYFNYVMTGDSEMRYALAISARLSSTHGENKCEGGNSRETSSNNTLPCSGVQHDWLVSDATADCTAAPQYQYCGSANAADVSQLVRHGRAV